MREPSLACCRVFDKNAHFTHSYKWKRGVVAMLCAGLQKSAVEERVCMVSASGERRGLRDDEEAVKQTSSNNNNNLLKL